MNTAKGITLLDDTRLVRFVIFICSASLVVGSCSGNGDGVDELAFGVAGEACENSIAEVDRDPSCASVLVRLTDKLSQISYDGDYPVIEDEFDRCASFTMIDWYTRDNGLSNAAGWEAIRELESEPPVLSPEVTAQCLHLAQYTSSLMTSYLLDLSDAKGWNLVRIQPGTDVLGVGETNTRIQLLGVSGELSGLGVRSDFADSETLEILDQVINEVVVRINEGDGGTYLVRPSLDGRVVSDRFVEQTTGPIDEWYQLCSSPNAGDSELWLTRLSVGCEQIAELGQL